MSEKEKLIDDETFGKVLATLLGDFEDTKELIPEYQLKGHGDRWFYDPEDKHLPYKNRRPHPLHLNRKQLQQEALDFVQLLLDAPINKIVVENPVGVISTKIRKPEQIIQPYMFGHSESKKTCLWLKNLEPLQPTNIVEEEERVVYASGKSMPKWYADAFKLPPEERWKVRSATFPGIAKAMADQWG